MSGEPQTETQEHAPTGASGEWIWRFLAGVLLFSVGWILWIAYQLNPPMLVTTAAFEAAAKAKASQNAVGVIASKSAAEAPKPEAEAPHAQAGAGGLGTAGQPREAEAVGINHLAAGAGG